MNVIGKILVILNLVFALVVGGFLVIDFATRTNWKQAYDKLKDEMKVARTNSDISNRSLGDIKNQLKRVEVELETAKQNLVDVASAAKATEENLKLFNQELQDKAKDADRTAQVLLAEKERLKEETKGLTATIAVREKNILALQDDVRKYRAEAVANEAVAKQMQQRNETLLAKVQEQERQIRRMEAGVGSDIISRDPNAPNPPAAKVRGTIEKVDPVDRTLVTISVGSDLGVNKNNTLEVYRMMPTPQYLGMIRIVDANHHKAVGRLMGTGIGVPRVLREGDIVSSSLSQ